jgi:D-threo-aldose 1-dehydrogenase
MLRPVPLSQVSDHGCVDPLPFTVDVDFSRDAILRSVEMSFGRFGLNRIDLLYVHDLERRSLGPAYDDHLRRFLNGGLQALQDLKSQGVIAGWGLGVNEVAAVTAVMVRTPMDALLLAGRYTLLDRSGAALMDRCHVAGTGVVIGGVFNAGILATGPMAGAQYNYAPPSADIAARVTAMQAIATA